ncbi:hypothetical protein L218DRAFT_964322 [Marasmius fiardii PR-910]|nr:hypothetical protein L218DRAFT_964322 [Marasmius fiardii PR-910]
MRYQLLLLFFVAAASAMPQRGGGRKGRIGQRPRPAKTAQPQPAKTATQNNAGGNTGQGQTNDPQTSLTLDPRVIAQGFKNPGDTSGGEVKSLTSTNNFINFCAGKTITDGKQFKDGSTSCNPVPMGLIPNANRMPSSKFIFPTNGVVLKTNTTFTIDMAVANLQMGNFVNPNTNYFAAPQTLNDQGIIIGHSHITVDKLPSLDSKVPTDPRVPAFFKGLNAPTDNGVASLEVTGGLPAGFYRLASINAAANHQPVLVAVAQHGSLDDMIYFTIKDDAPNADNGAKAQNANGAKKQAQGARPKPQKGVDM